MTNIADQREEYEKYFPTGVQFRDDMIFVTMADGVVIGNPLSWHSWLQKARPEQLINVQMNYFSIYWPDLDEALDTEGMMRGIPSHEAKPLETIEHK